VHGDAQLPNALLTEAGVVLVDLDEAGAGHPAVDVAGVLAALRRAVLLGSLDPERETVLAGRFSAAYADVAGAPDEAGLRWHTAAALLVGGAARAVRRVQAPTLQRLDVLLDHAVALAQGRAPLPGRATLDLRRTP
jgi:Ser/Thr protein kinase RdoA (MazF antagonist)